MNFLILLPPRTSLLAVTTVFALALPIAAWSADPPLKVESPTAATAGKSVLVVTESKRTQTIEPQGRDVSITGDHNKITLKGDCHALTVGGNHNEVTAEGVASISTSGKENRVTWTKAVGGEKPQITNLGSGNNVSKGAK